MTYRIERWKDSRFFALYRNDQLVVVATYRTGARAVQHLLEELEAQILRNKKEGEEK